MPDIISFTPVRTSAPILEAFLDRLRGEDLTERWLWDDGIPDGVDLTGFEVIGRSGIAATGATPHQQGSDYEGSANKVTHTWTGSAVSRVAGFKNHALDRFYQDYTAPSDAIFLVDSDVMVQPGTVAHLAAAEADVIAAVYWTQWEPSRPWMPQVWDFDNYSFRGPDSVVRLRTPGHYNVGGLGACTLISRAVIAADVDFTPLPNLSITGEDRWFCIRAAAAGFTLEACTHVEAMPFHVYRDEQLATLALGWDADAAALWLSTHLGAGWAAAMGQKAISV